VRILIKDAVKNTDKEVTLLGWIHRIRDLGKISFILLRDRSGIIQLVTDKIPDINTESVVKATGTLRSNEKAPGGVELELKGIEVLAKAHGDLPIAVNQDPSKLSLEAVLDHRILSLRNPKIRSIFTLQSNILKHFAAHLRSEDFTEIKTSKLIGTGTEGGTGLFPVQYFDRKVYLAQSPQFYKQAMVASGMERVFEIGDAYRAEKHDTPRHLNEYVSLDVEMAFIESEQDLMDLEQRILKSIFEGLKKDSGEIVKEWNSAIPSGEEVDKIPRITHDEAKEIVSSVSGKRVFEINPEGERILCEWAEKEHGCNAVFVYAFPRRKRPFYTFPIENHKTMSFDLLFRGLEITTGGRRINEYDMLIESIERFHLKSEGLADYLEIFKYGCPPHGGFAIGLERLTQKILGLPNVKEASLFPRDRKRVRP